MRGRGPHPQKVFVYGYPVEGSSNLLTDALSRYGEVHDVRVRHWLHMSEVADGVRVVSTVRNQAIPRNLYDIVACPFSDNCTVVMSARVPEVPSYGPGVWKLNLSVLNDPEYIILISNFWSDWLAAQPRFPTLAKWWDKGKSIIKGLIIRYCCVLVLLSGHNTVASCLAWQTT